MPYAKELLFKVKADGRDYCIYTNGEVEGFNGDQVLIFNHYPNLEAQTIAAERKRAASSAALKENPVPQTAQPLSFCG